MKIKTVLILAVMALFTIAICSIGQDVPKQTAPSTSEEQVAPESDMPYMCSMQDMGMGAGGCCGMGTCMNPMQDMGMGAGGCCGMGPCRGYGQGPVAPPGCGCCMGPGMGPGMGCGMGPGMGCGMGPSMGCGMGPSMGYSMRCGCQPWMMRDDWKDEQEQPPLKELDLSDDQVNKLIDLHAELQKKQIALHRKIDADQEKIGDLYDAEKLDETQLKKLVKEKAELQAELQINHRNSVDKALAVLTAEQKEKLGDCPIPFFGPQGDKFPGPGGKGLKGCQHRHRGR